MYIKIAIAKYTPTLSVLVGVAVILKVILGILKISKRVKGVVVKQMPL